VLCSLFLSATVTKTHIHVVERPATVWHKMGELQGCPILW